jgi:hypothetical protein
LNPLAERTCFSQVREQDVKQTTRYLTKRMGLNQKELQVITTHHETFSTTIQPPYRPTKG